MSKPPQYKTQCSSKNACTICKVTTAKEVVDCLLF